MRGIMKDIINTRKAIVTLLIVCLLSLYVQPVFASDDYQVMDKIKKKVHFVNPIDSFALYAFMNYTGYDDENYTGYHPARKALRDELNSMDIHISKPHYFSDISKNYPMLEADIASFTGWLGTAPNFVMEPKMRNVLGKYVNRNLSDLDTILTEFSKQVDIEKLYAKYNSYYENEINAHVDKTYDILFKTIKQFHLDISGIRDFDIYVNVFDMYHRGYMLDPARFDPTTTKPYILQVGPSAGGNGLNLSNIVHEFSHIFTTGSNKEKTQEYKDLTTALTFKYGSPNNSFYTTWNQIIEESFVRAMESWITGEDPDIQVHDGFVMTRYIYDRIKDFDTNSDLIFNDWIVDVMKGYTATISSNNPDTGSYNEGYDKGYREGYDKGYEEGKQSNGNVPQGEPEDRSLYTSLESKTNVSISEDWEVKFSLDIDASTIKEKNIFITDSKGVNHSMLYLIDRENGLSTVQLIPAKEYTKGETYTLWIKNIKSKNGGILKRWTSMDFTVIN